MEHQAQHSQESIQQDLNVDPVSGEHSPLPGVLSKRQRGRGALSACPPRYSSRSSGSPGASDETPAARDPTRRASGAAIAEHHHSSFEETFVIQSGSVQLSLDRKLYYGLWAGDVVYIPAEMVVSGKNGGRSEAVVIVPTWPERSPPKAPRPEDGGRVRSQSLPGCTLCWHPRPRRCRPRRVRSAPGRSGPGAFPSWPRTVPWRGRWREATGRARRSGSR